jgi:hypothetical protein
MGTISVKAPTTRLPGPAPANRVCAERGCRTILSTYNEDEACGQHGGWVLQRMNALEAMGELPHRPPRRHRRDRVGAAIEAVMA